MDKTQAETIKKELLAGAESAEAIQEVMDQHAHSKGPLYAALGQATSILSQKLAGMSHESALRENEREKLEEEISALKQELDSASERLKAKEESMASVTKALDEKNEFLELIKTAGGLGCGPQELTRLHDILIETATVTGCKSDEAVEIFFNRVEHYKNLVELEQQAEAAQTAAAKAKAVMEKHEAEMLATQAKSKARKVSIDATERLIKQGIKEADLGEWDRIVSSAGTSPHELAEALEHAGSLDLLLKLKQERLGELESETANLEGQLHSMKEERDKVAGSIQGIKEEAIGTLRSMSEAVLGEIETAGESIVRKMIGLDLAISEYADLREKAGNLAREMTLARVFASTDQEQWRSVAVEEILTLIRGALTWSHVNDLDPLSGPPESVQNASLISGFTKVRFTNLMKWAAYTLASEPARPNNAQRIIVTPLPHVICGRQSPTKMNLSSLEETLSP